MSFMGGGECSTGRNPLAQFTKHVTDDKSLQRDRMGPARPMGADGGFKTVGGEMTPADQQMMEQFYQENPQAGPFAFEQMRHELAQMHQQPMGAEPWAQEFGSQPHLTAEDQARFRAAFQQGQTGPSFSAADFAMFQKQGPAAVQDRGMAASPAASLQHQEPAFRQFQGYNFNGGMPFAANTAYQMQPPHMHHMEGKGKQVVELSDENWEAQFREMENVREVEKSNGIESLRQDAALDEAANKAIDAELNKKGGDFQAIWDGIQQAAREKAALETLDWDNTFDSSLPWDPESSLTQSIPRTGKYLFEPDNPYMKHQDPYAEGKRLVETGGNLSLAALAFEAAVQINQQHVEAWTDLGACQAMNEKETPAIRAYETALRLNEGNLSALMGLAVSYTNEGYDSFAYTSLESWLAKKYPDIVKNAGPPINTSADRTAIHERVTNMFIQAAMLTPEGEAMDADVQVGLGVLFYGDEEYDKAVDCFTAALNSSSTSTSPEHLLWNRLGATLANSGRSEEAINAYEHALTINPNFVRARYNLGVSCINIGCFQQAAEHLLGALAMHKIAEEKAREDARTAGVEPERIVQNQSTNLYDTLRRVFGQMGRRDLAERVENGMELDAFRKEFDF